MKQAPTTVSLVEDYLAARRRRGAGGRLSADISAQTDFSGGRVCSAWLAVYVFGSFDTSQPPPSALMSSTAASMRRRRISTSVASFW